MNKILKTTLAAAVVAIAAGVAMAPSAVNAWGDVNGGRTTYTLEQINAGKLGNTITLNSITNGKIGDERNFVGVKVNNKLEYDKVSVKDGDTMTVFLYVHNNSPKGKDGIAKDVTAYFDIPVSVAKSQTISGILTSSNANPGEIWDEVELTSTESFRLEYVTGSAKYTNVDANKKERTFDLSDEIIAKSGARLGYDTIGNGEIPGCFEYDGYVTLQVKVHAAVTSTFSKKVRLDGTEDWDAPVTAKVGDVLEYRLEYRNVSAEDVKKVVIRDELPSDVEYIKGSTIVKNANFPNWATAGDDIVTKDGLDVGGYKGMSNVIVKFKAKVVNVKLDCGDSERTNKATATADSLVLTDDVTIKINRNDETCQKKDDKKDEGKKDDTKKDDTKKDDTKKSEPVEKTDKIVNTGAGEVAGAALGAGSLVTALGYYIASRKKLM